MYSKLIVGVSVAVIVVIAGAFLVNMSPGGTATSTSSSSTSTSTTTVSVGGSYLNSPESLQLRLSVTAYPGMGSDGGALIQVIPSEYNTLAAANNVSMADHWPLDGLTLGACGTATMPFGVALYKGTYTAGNVSRATPLQIYPVVPCPMLIRYVTGYLFQPSSDFAVILPSGPNATATEMTANVNATAEYVLDANLTASSTPTDPLGPGTYSVAAGDEWGSVVVVHFTVGGGAATSTTTTASSTLGALEAGFSVGPTEPVCMANSTTGPAPSQYSSIEAVVTSQPSGQNATFPVSWLSDSCSVSGSFTASLPPGSYSLSLSSCQWMGCGSALPESFTISAGQTSSVQVSIDTGIR
jgi:hypothetical protein